MPVGFSIIPAARAVEAAGPPPTVLSAEKALVADKLGLDPEKLARLLAKPLYEFNEVEVGAYLGYLQAVEPDLRSRIVHLGRKAIGQPYEIYLLGEFPFETYDPLPLYSLEKSDCVVFSEHIYAMALTDSWPAFFSLLQRIRYRDGQIGIASRNHYTEADWNPNNSWLVRDVTAEIGGENVVPYTLRVDRARFLKNRYGLDTAIPVETVEEIFIPFEAIDEVKPLLTDGDFVNIVRGRGGQDGSYWVGHVGLIGIGDDGEVNFIHSAEPAVREEPIDEYIRRSSARNVERDAAGQARFFGFKFLRLEDNPLANLAALDGGETPRLQAPGEARKAMNPAAGRPRVTPGIDRLLDVERGLIEGKRIGLITNPTGITADGRQNIDALIELENVELVKLFGPEHGVRGEYYAGDYVAEGIDSVTGLPMHSLYGQTRRPRPEWLEDIDALVYDIQDTSNRSYTFIYTMAYAMEAAHDAGIPFIVCDRPDPFGGTLVDGNILDPEKGTSFVGLYPIAYLYGMTPGELARYFNREFGIGCDLHVVEMTGWRRSMTYDQTGLMWVLPSQHVPRYETCYYMAITGMLGELHSVNEGVGFTLPFEMIAAPWIDRQELADELNGRDLPGVHFRPHAFVPRYGRFSEEAVEGVQIHIRDFGKVRPVATGIHIMEALQKLYSGRNPLGDPSDATSLGRIRMFNRVMGTDTIHRDLLAGRPAAEIVADWEPGVEAFMETRAKYLIYR